MSVVKAAVRKILSIHAMEPSDIQGVLRIEDKRNGQRWVLHGAPDKLTPTDQFIWVAKVGSLVVGYLVYQLVPESKPDGTERSLRQGRPGWPGRVPVQHPLRINILHIFVAPEWRRRGVGHLLLERFDPKLPQQHLCRLVATVPETNLPAQLLLQACGFHATDVLRHYASDDEDAYLMERRLG